MPTEAISTAIVPIVAAAGFAARHPRSGDPLSLLFLLGDTGRCGGGERAGEGRCEQEAERARREGGRVPQAARLGSVSASRARTRR